MPNVVRAICTLGMGNGHGMFLDCGDLSWASSGCTSVTYGDPYTVMSLGIGHFSTWRKISMGWFNPVSNKMLEVLETGDYILEPYETNTGGAKALRCVISVG